ncbi:hypothetical protein QCA50_018950 [Cerrena zonata]|uniref:Uncharacterized protein n=1 Tax=Cerrena zonata TaxID=2478898 RepID=A0AAW0FMY8_9APHY
MLSQITGIYPTVIAVLVSFRLSWENTLPPTVILTSAPRFAIASIENNSRSGAYNTSDCSGELQGKTFGNGRGVDVESLSSTHTSSTIEIRDVFVHKVFLGQADEEHTDISDNMDDHEKTETMEFAQGCDLIALGSESIQVSITINKYYNPCPCIMI